ncbi:dihydropteroate synthase [Maritalea myrionectae]|uniref:Dihydropteroate synthase n=1 Tax=Maritalea myrionectae TaxID=454601 RepID=A0A2R4MEX7_9HYPH|nr:dihydropteroate synthase [Maritalea myrionectae]
MMHQDFTWQLKSGERTLGRDPLVMGILNVTPDSFSDGGDFTDRDKIVAQAQKMVAEGADILDIGGESTRPGSEAVAAQEELDRVLLAIDALKESGITVPISIDSYKAIVGQQAMEAGAEIINDVWGFQRDPELADVAVHYGCPAILMHWDPDRDREKDLIGEMNRFFEKSLQIAENAGISKSQIALDPGFGFAKNFDENYELLRRVDELHALGYPLLIGTSRKSMFGKLLGNTPKERVAATAASTVLAYEKGAHIFRVHDVRENLDALHVVKAMLYGPPPPKDV